MASIKSGILLLTLAVFSPEVTSWVVDMAEVERSLGAIQQQELDYDEVTNESEASEGDNEITYASNYAEKFEYGTFRKKEVVSVLKHGGEYLEGLSGALAAYRAVLEGCRRNSSEAHTAAAPAPDELKACATAEQKKRVVQKLSRLALGTTDKLRDMSFEDTDKEDDGEEKTSLVQLAWSLDRLAALTGFGPVSNHEPDIIHPKIPESTSNVATAVDEQKNLELLEQVENGRPLLRFPPTRLTAVKSVQKRDTSDAVKYYVKYKVWNGSNSMNDQRNVSDHFEVGNSIINLAKRSVPDKKAANMRGVLQANGIKCNVKEQSKNKSKLVKYVKVYRRKVLKKSNQ